MGVLSLSLNDSDKTEKHPSSLPGGTGLVFKPSPTFIWFSLPDKAVGLCNLRLSQNARFSGLPESLDAVKAQAQDSSTTQM